MSVYLLAKLMGKNGMSHLPPDMSLYMEENINIIHNMIKIQFAHQI